MDGAEIYRDLEQVAEEIELRRAKTLTAVDDFIDEDIRPGDITMRDLINMKGISRGTLSNTYTTYGVSFINSQSCDRIGIRRIYLFIIYCMISYPFS